MDHARRQALALSLRQRLETQPASARTSWVEEQIENYLERWLAFRALTTTNPPPADDDLFAMIEIGAGILSDEFRDAKLSPELTKYWSEFLDLLAAVRKFGDEGVVGKLRSKLAQVRSSA
jgi:hypothetical protein